MKKKITKEEAHARAKAWAEARRKKKGERNKEKKTADEGGGGNNSKRQHLQSSLAELYLERSKLKEMMEKNNTLIEILEHE